MPLDDEGAINGVSYEYQCWGYDGFGNRIFELENVSTACPSPAPTASTASSYVAPTNSLYNWTTVNAANRVTFTTVKNASNGYIYDLAGNVVYDGVNNYAYDAEGRICAVASPGPTFTQYVYDAEGRRVAKGAISNEVWPSGGPTCYAPTAANSFSPEALYLRGQQGDQDIELDGAGYVTHQNIFEGGGLAATYWNTGTDASPAFEMSYNFSDWLGSKRLQTNNNPSPEVYWRSDPFGDYLTAYGSELDATGQYAPLHFTGKERDAESGNDYFGARYYGSSMGRFMSPDPVFISAQRLADPQSLNLYAYVRNNPLGLTDDTGLDFYLACATSDHSGCGQVQNGSSSVWVQGQTVNGSFQAADVDMNQQGNPGAGYSDQFGNNYSGTFDQNNGVSFTNTATGATSGNSQFIDGSDNTQLNGSGAFSNITGNFFSDCGGSCQGRAALSGSAAAFAATEAQLNKQGGLTTALDRLSGAHKGGAQWKDSNGYVHMLQSPSGQMEMHFEGHPTGVDVQQFVLHMVDTIRDATSGRANQEKNATLPQ